MPNPTMLHPCKACRSASVPRSGRLRPSREAATEHPPDPPRPLGVEGQKDVGAALVACVQATEAVQPSVGASRHSAVTSKAPAVVDAPRGTALLAAARIVAVASRVSRSPPGRTQRADTNPVCPIRRIRPDGRTTPSSRGQTRHPRQQTALDSRLPSGWRPRWLIDLRPRLPLPTRRGWPSKASSETWRGEWQKSPAVVCGPLSGSQNGAMTVEEIAWDH